MRIRAGDLVEVIAGTDRGVRAKVLRVDRRAGSAVVEGVNRAYKHVRRSQKHPQGGRLSKEMPLSLSNLLLVCPSCKRAVRTGVRYTDDGSKQRHCKKCGAEMGRIAPPKTRHAGP
ncbi:MAG: 50S ribosomal protein L24 [Planctomycetes bacterium RBG_16_64_10]|nr:MAG: 50S ribosomal protein L24 [Planctomycetes bacterium RBG_16_64_10]